VVFSVHFFAKKWTKKELNGLFSRELQGNRVRILPVLHKLNVGELKRRYPIQGDRFCLKSDSPMEELIENLLKVIKPALLDIDELKTRAADSATALIAAARKKYPGWDFSISKNSPTDDSTTKQMFLTSGDQRIGMRIADPSALRKPPTFSLHFTGTGAAKADEFVKTGKAQAWNPGEFKIGSSFIPLFPRNSPGLVLSVAPSKPQRQVRVEVDGAPQLVFPLMSMGMVAGTEELTLDITSAREPLAIYAKLRLAAGTSWRVSDVSLSFS
jgi:hypothetical protein